MAKDTLKNILVVDDNEDHLYITKSRLEQENKTFRVEVVRSAEECLRILEGREFDCILSDYEMKPGMNGIDLLQELNARNIDVPFIVITDQGNEQIESEARRKGAEDYFPKSEGYTDFSKVISSIRKAIDRRRSKPGADAPGVSARASRPSTSEQRYRDLFAQLPDIGLVLKTDGMTIEEANPAAAELFGMSEEAVAGTTLNRFVRPEDRTVLRKLVLEALKGKKQTLVIHLIDADGEPVPLTVSCNALVEDGKLKGAILTAKPCNNQD